jgi:DNA replication and repair protein RecF
VRLLHLSLKNFRNLAEVALKPSAQATIVVGQNGQGKTNLLEALYYLATLKPLRAAKLGQLIRFDCKAAQVNARFELQGAEREISVEVTPAARQVFVDSKKAASLEQYFGGVAVVAFTPDDLEVIKGAPDSRRQLLDRAVFNRFPAFLKESREYLRALKSRNRLLKEGAARAYIEAYDETLARAGARIWARRRTVLNELAPRAEKAFAAIVRTSEPARYAYAPVHLPIDFSDADEPTLAEALLEQVRSRTPRDQERGFTSVGPHADDLEIRIGPHSARSFASQGQQRALVLALKIGEIENLRAALGHLPLLLLDDVSSELDRERNAYLMEYLASSGAQVFLTTTDPSLVRQASRPNTAWFHVNQGSISEHTPESDSR